MNGNRNRLKVGDYIMLTVKGRKAMQLAMGSGSWHMYLVGVCQIETAHNNFVASNPVSNERNKTFGGWYTKRAWIRKATRMEIMRDVPRKQEMAK